LTVLSGLNGTGKSSVIQSLFFSLSAAPPLPMDFATTPSTSAGPRGASTGPRGASTGGGGGRPPLSTFKPRYRSGGGSSARRANAPSPASSSRRALALSPGRRAVAPPASPSRNVSHGTGTLNSHPSRTSLLPFVGNCCDCVLCKLSHTHLSLSSFPQLEEDSSPAMDVSGR